MDKDKKVDEAKTTIESVVKELRTAVESKEAESAQTKEKLEKLSGEVSKFEQVNQALVKSIEAEKTAKQEIADKFEVLEKKMLRVGSDLSTDEKSNYKTQISALEKWAVKGVDGNFSDLEKKYIRTDNNVDGGFLATTDYVREINKQITEISEVRMVAKVRQTNSKDQTSWRRDSLVQSYHTVEGAPQTNSNSTYGLNVIPVHSITTATKVTTFILGQDGGFNWEGEVQGDFVESQALLEGQDFVNGTGVNMSKGFLQNTSIEKVNSGIAASFDWDSLAKTATALKKGYKPMWAFNRSTLFHIMSLKDGEDRYLWSSGNVAAGIPNSVWGFPYMIWQAMPDIAADAYPVVFGDFRRGYTIVDGRTITFLRNPYREDGFVRFSMEKFVGGDSELPEAIKILKCAV